MLGDMLSSTTLKDEPALTKGTMKKKVAPFTEESEKLTLYSGEPMKFGFGKSRLECYLQTLLVV